MTTLITTSVLNTQADLGLLHPSYKGAMYPYTRTAGGEQHLYPVKTTHYTSKDVAESLLLWLQMGDMPLWLYGPHGSGKTSTILQMAAVLGQPVIFDNGDPEAEKSDFNGVMGIDGGETKTVYSSLAQAAMNGWWYVLNEADLIRSGVLTSLNTLLDDTRCIVIQHSGEVIKPAPGFRLIVTANSVGRGDYTGKHQVERQNRALMDRFFKMSVDYPAPAVEMEILKKAFPVPAHFGDESVWDAVLESYITFANMIRDAHKGQEIEINGPKQQFSLSETLSTRSLLLWIKANNLTAGKRPFKKSLNYLLALDAPEAEVDNEIIDKIGLTVFGTMWTDGVQGAATNAA